MFNWFSGKPSRQDALDDLKRMCDEFELAGFKFLEYQAVYDHHPQWKDSQKEEYGKLLECARLIYGQCIHLREAYLENHLTNYTPDTRSALLAFTNLSYKFKLHMLDLHELNKRLFEDGPVQMEIDDIECSHDDICRETEKNREQLKQKLERKHG